MPVLVPKDAVCNNCGKRIHGYPSEHWYHDGGDSRCTNYSDTIIATPKPGTIITYPDRTLEDILYRRK